MLMKLMFQAAGDFCSAALSFLAGIDTKKRNITFTLQIGISV